MFLTFYGLAERREVLVPFMHVLMITQEASGVRIHLIGGQSVDVCGTALLIAKKIEIARIKDMMLQRNEPEPIDARDKSQQLNLSKHIGKVEAVEGRVDIAGQFDTDDEDIVRRLGILTPAEGDEPIIKTDKEIQLAIGFGLRRNLAGYGGQG